MFKLAIDAGHGAKTAGKRCLKSLDPNETREWWLNNRIADALEDILSGYEGVEILRVDDSDDGQDDIALTARVNAANKWGADFYLSIHHNAGASGSAAGGIVAYTHPSASSASRGWRVDLYEALIKYTGLKGNRATPLATADHYVTRMTKMPAVLLEMGFMDSKTDVPIILTNAYAQQCAGAIAEVVIKRGELTKKVEPKKDSLYRVQVGAFSKKANAEKLQKELAAKGYQSCIVRASE